MRSLIKKSTSILLIAKVTITILFVYFVNKTVIKTPELLLESFSLKIVFIALFFSVISILFQWVRWHISLNLLGINTSFKRSGASLFLGNLFAIITPAGSGELLRAIALKNHNQKKIVLATLTERLIAIATLFILGMLFKTILPANEVISKIFNIGIIIAGLTSTIFLILLPIITQKLNNNTIFDIKNYLSVITLTLLITLILFMQTANLLSFYFPELAFGESMIISAEAYSGMQFMPITIANMGVREYNLGQFALIYLGDTLIQDKILAVSIIIFMVNLLFPAIPGVIVLFLLGIKEKNRGVNK